MAQDAIRQDPAYPAGHYRAQPQGLALARALAMLSYRTPASFERRWGAAPPAGEQYPLRQGQKFLARFDANSYLVLSAAMDSHDVGRERGGLRQAMRRLRLPMLFLGVDTDLLYPAAEVEALARWAGADFALLRSPHGHDAFLIETRRVGRLLAPYLPEPWS